MLLPSFTNRPADCPLLWGKRSGRFTPPHLLVKASSFSLKSFFFWFLLPGMACLAGVVGLVFDSPPKSAPLPPSHEAIVPTASEVPAGVTARTIVGGRNEGATSVTDATTPAIEIR